MVVYDPQSEKKEIIRMLADRRKAKGITNKAVADAFNMQPSSTLRREQEEYEITIEYFLKLCAFLQEDPLELIEKANARVKKSLRVG